MNIRSVWVCLAMLGPPISSFALEVHVAVVDPPSQVNVSNMAAAAIAATGLGFLPYTLGGGYSITCSFTGSQEIVVDRVENFWTAENTVYVPGPARQDFGLYHMAGFESIPNGQCLVCTMRLKAIITTGLSVGLQGSGYSITFGGGELRAIDTKTFLMCKEPDEQCD